MFGKGVNKPKEIKNILNSGDCHLPFGLEYFVVPFSVQKHIKKNTHNSNLVCFLCGCAT